VHTGYRDRVGKGILWSTGTVFSDLPGSPGIIVYAAVLFTEREIIFILAGYDADLAANADIIVVIKAELWHCSFLLFRQRDKWGAFVIRQ
jgi:hypothetical protein